VLLVAVALLSPFLAGPQRALALGLLALAFLAGALVGEDRRLRMEAAMMIETHARVRRRNGIRATMEAALEEVVTFLGAQELLLAVADQASDRAYLWHMQRGPQAPPLRLVEMTSADRERYLFPGSDGAWAVIRHQTEWEELVLDGESHRTPVYIRDRVLDLVRHHPFDALLTASDRLGDWVGRVFLLGGRDCRWGEAEARFLQRYLSGIAPLMHNSYLRRLRTRVGAQERARVARELHDGVIQSLFGLEMRVDVLRREATDHTMAQELKGIQLLLRHEVVALRELMAQMRPLDLGPDQLIDYLADSVDRFGRDTGINAAFVSDLEEVSLPSNVCSELARVVQEAMVNVRKHSGARNLLVRLGRAGGRLQLVIDDDGRGFGFAGRLTQHDLDAQRKGPSVIRERLRSIGGDLTIESIPGRGARLEIGIG
jgi:signal transduction histidine kinase